MTSAHPAPTEPHVFDASSETQQELGIVKWGFDSKSDGDEMIYRGYGDRNQVLTEVVRKLDRSNDQRWVLTLRASGERGAAHERIEMWAEPKANGDSEIYTMVTENTFEEGKDPLKVLMRFKADGTAYAQRDALPNGSALVSETADELVDRCQQLASRCMRLLIRDEIAADGQSSECGLLRTLGVPLLGGVIGGIAGAPAAGIGALPGAYGGFIAGAAGQQLLCINAQFEARRAREEFQQCQEEKRQNDCAVTN